MKWEEQGSTFSSRLETALKYRDVRKIYPLAMNIGVDESAISRWRRGKSPSTENAVKLCDVLNVSVDWLLTGRGNMEPPACLESDLARTLAVELSRLSRRETSALANVFTCLAEICEQQPFNNKN